MSRRKRVHIKSTKALKDEWSAMVEAVHQSGCVHSPLFPKSKSMTAPNMRLWLPDGTHMDFATWIDDDELCRKEIAMYKSILGKAS